MVVRYSHRTCLTAAIAAIALTGAARQAVAGGTIGPVFVIAMENHNFTQPATYSNTQAIYGNTAAPFINSLVTPGNTAAQYVSYASNYVNSISPVTHNESHPSEPAYLFSEAGTDFGITNDNQPFGAGGTELPTGTQHLTGLLQSSGQSWKSYQEDTQMVPTSGGVNTPGPNSLTNTVAAPGNFTVPLQNFSGTSPSYTNPYNGSQQYNYAAKHNPQIFFPDTSGGNNTTNSNPLSSSYAPMQQLSTDLTGSSYAKYNWITPDQYNDMHTGLSAGFTDPRTSIHYTGDAANIAQGDYYLSVVVPQIEASAAFQNQNGTIVIWNDETEGDTVLTRGQFSSMEIVISKLAKGNAFNSTIQYSHSSDLKTYQELYSVAASTTTAFLGDATNATDLADLFQSGALPNAGASSIPEPASVGLVTVSAIGLLARRR